MSLQIIGIGQQFSHHFQVKGADWSIEILEPSQLTDEIRPDVAIVANEVFPEYRRCVPFFRDRGVPTLYAIDGILEWRHSWEFPPSTACGQTFRPVLSDKVACIGRSQARILESWGNVGKCEIVGVPRFDTLPAIRPDRTKRRAEGSFRLLVMTAKNPGFDEVQRERTRRSLSDLNQWIRKHPKVHGRRIEPVWRLTSGMDREIGVEGTASDTTGKQLAEVLQEVDAVITTQSTSMLESMRMGLPVALLDYHNCPHFVPAAWTISAEDHLQRIIPELISPPEQKMLWQDSILHDALECQEPATHRYVQLVEEMAEAGRQCRSENRPLAYPARILADPAAGFQRVEERFDLAKLFPETRSFQEPDLQVLRVEHAHMERTVRTMELEIDALRSQLAKANGHHHDSRFKDRSLKAKWGRLKKKLGKLGLIGREQVA